VSRILLDTSAYSAFMRDHPELKVEVQKAQEVLVSPIVLAELMAGFLRGGRWRKNRMELDTFLSADRVRVLGIDEETAERYAVIPWMDSGGRALRSPRTISGSRPPPCSMDCASSPRTRTTEKSHR